MLLGSTEFKGDCWFVLNSNLTRVEEKQRHSVEVIKYIQPKELKNTEQGHPLCDVQ